MENVPHQGTPADLEMRAARVADPGLGEWSIDPLEH